MITTILGMSIKNTTKTENPIQKQISPKANQWTQHCILQIIYK